MDWVPNTTTNLRITVIQLPFCSDCIHRNGCPDYNDDPNYACVYHVKDPEAYAP